MIRTILTRALAALCALASVACPAAAAQSVHCFAPETFAQPLTGICIRSVPQGEGSLRLGERDLQAGDVLTAEQAAAMTFLTRDTDYDRVVQVGYLPVFADRVGEEAQLTLSLRGKENKPPVAEDSAMETYKNLPNTAKLKVSDPEGETLSYTLVRQPRRGTVELSDDGSFTYTPKKNKVGVDSFTYTAADPDGKISREATVTVTILKPTDREQYTDTLGKDCRFAAEWMRHTGIFAGEQLGENVCFGPEKNVTRGEFLTMAVEALEIPTGDTLDFTGCSGSVPGWLEPYLAAALRSGLTAGLFDRSFEPEKLITGAEAAQVLENALDDPVFSDLTDAPLTRAEAAQVLYEAAKLYREQGRTDTIV